MFVFYLSQCNTVDLFVIISLYSTQLYSTLLLQYSNLPFYHAPLAKVVFYYAPIYASDCTLLHSVLLCFVLIRNLLYFVACYSFQ